jgi:hypothetical protein
MIGQTSTKGPEEKMDMPEKTEAEKLASLDSCIESSLRSLVHDLIKKRDAFANCSNTVSLECGIMIAKAYEIEQRYMLTRGKTPC